jgi:hypothetical protein
MICFSSYSLVDCPVNDLLLQSVLLNQIYFETTIQLQTNCDNLSNKWNLEKYEMQLSLYETKICLKLFSYICSLLIWLLYKAVSTIYFMYSQMSCE